MGTMRHRCKFRDDRPSRCRYMTIYLYQNGYRPPSWILKRKNFNCRYGLEGQCAPNRHGVRT